jgi:sugar fermentation stimulation protein A
MKYTLPADHPYDISWPAMVQGNLIRRYQRFKADVKLRNGHIVTAHCPNTGSMKECSEPGFLVLLSKDNSPTRTLKYTWELIKMPSSLVGVNTRVPNILVREVIRKGKVPLLRDYDRIRSEVKYGSNSRIDILLEDNGRKCFVEIKNCTLVNEGIAYFPDAVSERGLKHLVELQGQVKKGHRSVMFYLIQRMDANIFRPADHIDRAYGKELRKAIKNGVEILAYDTILDFKGIGLNKALPYEL